MESVGGVRVSRRKFIAAGLAAIAAAVGIKKLTSEDNPPKPPMGIKEINVEGVQVLKSGDQGPNIIFLHNAGQVPLGMTEHILNLSEAGQVIAPNIFDLIRVLQLRGNKNPGFADIANEISRLDLLDRRKKTGLVSTSFGASVAWEYTAQHPNDVEWNVAGSPTGWPLKRSLVGWMAAFTREFLLPSNPRIPSHLKKRDPGSGLMQKRAREDFASVWQGLKLTMDADQRAVMRTIKTPADLLWGKTDHYIPPWTQQMVKDVFPTNGRLIIASEYNHLWLAVEPEKLTEPAIQRARKT